MNELISRFWMHPVGVTGLFLFSVYVIYEGVRLVRTLQRLKQAPLEEAREMSQFPFKTRNLLISLGVQVSGWFLFPRLNPDAFSMIGIEEFTILNLLIWLHPGYIWIITLFAKKRIQVLAESGDYYALTGVEKKISSDEANV